MRWSIEKAWAWQERTGWLCGVNFVPSTAVNQLEMWQEATFDRETITRELGWAASIGFNSIRIFLHHLLWQQDSRGFLQRINEVLLVAHNNGLKVVPVLLDGAWSPYPFLGPQDEPQPGIHNSGWVQSPGAEVFYLQDYLSIEPYITGVLRYFATDKRIVFWDLFNEPDNPNTLSYYNVEVYEKAQKSAELLESVFTWARQVNPSQPLTCGVWNLVSPLSPAQDLALEESDIISFHSYQPVDTVRKIINYLGRYQRPLMCTEYLARGQGSTVFDILPLLKERKIGAFNWGLVSGKTQTIYPWDSWGVPYDEEPNPWHQDLLRPDGTAYDDKEIELIRSLTRRT